VLAEAGARELFEFWLPRGNFGERGKNVPRELLGEKDDVGRVRGKKRTFMKNGKTMKDWGDRVIKSECP